LPCAWGFDTHRIGKRHDTEALIGLAVIDPNPIIGLDVPPIHVSAPFIVDGAFQEHFFERCRASIRSPASFTQKVIPGL
jgi:hypothetical protein